MTKKKRRRPDLKVDSYGFDHEPGPLPRREPTPEEKEARERLRIKAEKAEHRAEVNHIVQTNRILRRIDPWKLRDRDYAREVWNDLDDIWCSWFDGGCT